MALDLCGACPRKAQRPPKGLQNTSKTFERLLQACKYLLMVLTGLSSQQKKLFKVSEDLEKVLEPKIILSLAMGPYAMIPSFVSPSWRIFTKRHDIMWPFGVFPCISKRLLGGFRQSRLRVAVYEQKRLFANIYSVL